jgi:MFS family permease
MADIQPQRIESSPRTGEPSPAADRARRSALLVVFLVMFIDLLGFGIVLPLLPRYGDQFVEPLVSRETHAGLHGAILGALMASFSAMQFLFAPIWGRISDSKGRRPFLILGLVGSVLFYGLFGVASELGSRVSALEGLLLLFVARIGAGIAGATVSTAQAVIADTTTPETRSRGMALIGVAFGIGFTFGPALGFGALSLFPNKLGAPGFTAAAFSFIALLIAIFLMPETWRSGLSGPQRGWLNLSAWQTALQTPTVGALIAAFFLSTLAFSCFEPTLPLLTKDVLNYEDNRNFLVFVYVGFVLMMTQGGLYQTLARRGVTEMTFMLVGATLMLLGLGGLGGVAARAGQAGDTAPPLFPFLAALTVAVIGFAFVTPSVQALVSRRTDPSKQGTVLGVNQSANALSRILGPMAGVGLYYLPPAHVLPYVFSVMLLVGFLLLALRVRNTG